MPKVFVSYSREDEIFVRDFVQKLDNVGLNIWVDWRSIAPGYPWREAIFEGIGECEAVILCLSPHYTESEMCRMEAFLARTQEKLIIPIMIEKCYDRLLKYRELKGLEDMHNLEFFGMQSIGLPVNEDFLIERIISTLKYDESKVVPNIACVAYPWEEATYATQVSDDLEAAGIGVWISTRDNIAGTDWQLQQWKALRLARAFLVIINSRAASSSNVRRQILFAKVRKLPILPIVPPSIADNRQALVELANAFDANYETRLIGEINWFYPNPNHETMVENLINAIKKLS